MISDLVGFLYIWVTVLFFWHYKVVSLKNSKPPMLLDKFIAALFVIVKIAWTALSIYLLFTDWTILLIPLAAFLAIKYTWKAYEQIENVCLIPLTILYSIGHLSEIKKSLKNNKTRTKINLLDAMGGLFIILFVTSLIERFFPFEMAIKQFEAGQMKPSWAVGLVLILLIEPYKIFIYISTIAVGFICLVLFIYKKWFKKEK